MGKNRFLAVLVAIMLLAPMGQFAAAEDLATPVVETPEPVVEEEGDVAPTETPDGGTDTARMFALTDSTFIPNTGGVDFTFSTSDGSAVPSGYRMCVEYDDLCVTVGPGTQSLADIPAGRLDFLLRADGASQHYSADPISVYVAAGVNVPVSVVLSPFDSGAVTLNITTADGGALPESISVSVDWENAPPVANGATTYDGLTVGSHTYQIHIGGTHPLYVSTDGTFTVTANNTTTVNVVLQPQNYVTVVFDVTTSDGNALGDGWTACFVGGKGVESICAPVVGGVATVTDVPEGYYGTHFVSTQNPQEQKKYQAAQDDTTVGSAEIQHIAVELQRRSGTGAIVVDLHTSDSSPVDPQMGACVYSNDSGPGAIRYSICLPYDGESITFPNVPAGSFQLYVDYNSSGEGDESPYENAGNQSVQVAEGETVTISKTLTTIVYGTVEVTVQTDDGGTPPAGYRVCLAGCQDLTQIGVPISFTSPAGTRTLSVRYEDTTYLAPYSTLSTQVEVTGNTTRRFTITLHRFAYIPVRVTITDGNGAPVTDRLQFSMNGQTPYAYNGATTVWVEAGKGYNYTVYGGQTYRDLTGTTNVPANAPDHTLAIRLEAYPTGTFTLNVPSGMPAPETSGSQTLQQVSLRDDVNKSLSVPIANGTTGPVTWHAGEVDYFHSYYSANGHVRCDGSFTNTVGGNVTVPMDCTYTPDEVEPGGIEALIAAIIAILIEILASMES